MSCIGRLCASFGLGSAVAIAVAPPTGAQAQSECIETLASYDAMRHGMNQHLSDHELRGFGLLRSSAEFLAQNEREDACEELVEAYGEMIADRRQALVDEGLMVEVEEQERVDQLQAAPKVSEVGQPLRAGEIIGNDLRNTMNEGLGDIEDVVFDPETGGISHVLVETGGFLGLGEKTVAVPLEALSVTDNMNTFVLDMSTERFAEAPTVDDDDMTKVQETEWQEQNDRYYLAAEQ